MLVNWGDVTLPNIENHKGYRRRCQAFANNRIGPEKTSTKQEGSVWI